MSNNDLINRELERLHSLLNTHPIDEDYRSDILKMIRNLHELLGVSHYYIPKGEPING